MFVRILRALLLSGLGLVLPGWIEPQFLLAPQPWILLAIGTLATLFQPAHSPLDRSRTPEDRGTATQILWSIYLVQTAALVEAAWLRYPESVTWTGWTTGALLAMVGGLALRTWAVRTLGRFFTWHVEVQDGQTVIQEGPYRWVRHPSYTGALMTWYGATIFLMSWYSALLGAVLLPLAFLRRIRHEERLLVTELDDYADYRRRVSALIPKLL